MKLQLKVLLSFFCILALLALVGELQLRRRETGMPGPILPVPTLTIPQSFSGVKEPDQVRLLFVGGSVLAGFPYPSQASVPTLVAAILQQQVPTRTIQVLNVSDENTTSGVILESLPALLDLHPDVLLLQCGDEEFSPANLERPEHQALAQRLAQSGIRRSRLVATVLSLFEPIETVATGREIIPSFPQALSSVFATNLRAIAQYCKSKGVPLVLLDLPSNIRDWTPDHLFSKPLSYKTRELFEDLVGQIQRALELDDLSTAQQLLQQAQPLDPASPHLAYYLGVVHDRMHAWEEAKAYYHQALDLDYLPTRAPRLITEQLTETAASMQIPLVNTTEVLLTRCADLPDPAPCPGFETFTDDKHPGLEARKLIAQELAAALIPVLNLGQLTVQGSLEDVEVHLTDEEQYDMLYRLARRHLKLWRTKRGMFLLQECMRVYPYHASAVELLIETLHQLGMPDDAQKYSGILIDLQEKERFRKPTPQK